MSRVVVVDGFASFRPKARALAAAGIPPDEVLFREAEDGQEILPALASEAGVGEVPLGVMKAPRRFVAIAERVACHRDPSRYALLYRVLYRIVREDRLLLDHADDADVRALDAMDRQVRKDVERMKGLLRFRAVERLGETRYVAWYRPEHAILALVTPFFVERLGAMRWSIFTPDASAHWDGGVVSFGDGVARSSEVVPGIVPGGERA